MSIGNRIKDLRKKQGLTQTELGKVCQLNYGAISAIESDRSKPTTETVLKMSEFFKVSTDYILTGKEEINTISAEEQEIIEMYRKDSQLKEAFELIKSAKKKVISYMQHKYQQPAPTLYELREESPVYNAKS